MVMTPTGGKKELESLVTIRMSKDLRDRLKKLAVKDRRTLSDYVRLCLEDLVERGGRREK